MLNKVLEQETDNQPGEFYEAYIRGLIQLRQIKNILLHLEYSKPSTDYTSINSYYFKAFSHLVNRCRKSPPSITEQFDEFSNIIEYDILEALNVETIPELLLGKFTLQFFEVLRQYYLKHIETSNNLRIGAIFPPSVIEEYNATFK
jgi:hypothetical protein